MSNTNVTKHRNCLACPSGFYQAKEQESECEKCPAGWSSQNDEGSKACEVRLEWRTAQGGPCVPAQALKPGYVVADGCPEPVGADNESVTILRAGPRDVLLQWVSSENAQWAKSWKSTETKTYIEDAKLTGWEIEI